jgi:hypothetical protein
MTAFALDSRGHQVLISNGQVCTWWMDMFGGRAGPEDRWYKIPDEHLHSGMVMAYVQFVAFMEQTGLFTASTPVPPPRDERPLITPQFREENEEEWDRLWNNRPDECPVCHESPDIWDGPMNSGIPTRCTHWACTECWKQISGFDKRCPICRDDLREWLSHRDDSDMDE